MFFEDFSNRFSRLFEKSTLGGAPLRAPPDINPY